MPQDIAEALIPQPPATIRAAGVLFMDADNRILFVQRSHEGDFAGHWALPGGKIEEGETAAQAAAREVQEEVGHTIDPANLREWVRCIRDGVDFTTFLYTKAESFDVKLNNEHLAHTWALRESPPQPLHPGVLVALARFDMNELGVAQAMMAGDLSSPQFYENIALFDMRITGTGVAWRKKMGEFAYRDPALYLNEEFLARCNGLPVIMEHPQGNILNTKEFQDRTVGTILMPYIKGEEVWGIAKIYDMAAAEMLTRDQLSTSPAVVWRDPDVNNRVELEDGSKLLIEGKPSLLDHLAICEHGVWDKGGEPTGVSTTVGDSVMADEKDKDEKAGDSGGEHLDKLLKGIDALTSKLDSMGARMDSMEEEMKKGAADSKRKDSDEEEGKPEPVAADKRKDSEKEEERKDSEKEDEMAKDSKKEDDCADDAGKAADAAKAAADATNVEVDKLRRELADLRAAMPKGISDADLNSFSDAQSRCDAVAQMFGENAPRNMNGESVLQYRRRLVEKYKAHSAAWSKVDLRAISVDQAAFDAAESQIYADAAKAARLPTSVPAGRLRPVVSKSPTGHTVTDWLGSPSSWMNRHASNRRYVTAINLQKGA